MQHSHLRDNLPARLSLWDAVSIIVGIVVGVSIFKVPAVVFSNVERPWHGLAAWLFGGVLSLVGALCYSELATTYPRSGGDYEYLTRAYGRWAGFLFGWAQLVAILTGSIGAMAYVFADYAVEFWQRSRPEAVWFAAGAVVGLSLMNVAGVAFGKTTQNILTVAKVLGLAGILAAGFMDAPQGSLESLGESRPLEGPGFGLAMILVLYAYGGWNDAAFVAAEVRNRRRNIPRALLVGVTLITLLYLLVNAAFLSALGFEGLRNSPTPAAAVLHRTLGARGGQAMSVLVMVSALGAINGLIFTGSRIFYSLGNDHRLFAPLGRWHSRLGSPAWSLLAQSLVSLLLILFVGTPSGRNSLDATLAQLGLRPLPWQEFGGGFDTLVAGTAPVFWLFFLMTGVALCVLRLKDRHTERPFRVPLFPLLPVVFCGMCGWMLYSSIAYARELSLLGIVPLLAGLPVYALSRRRSS